MKLNSLNDVLTDQLADLYSAERQLVEALPKVAGAASSTELRDAIEEHLEETRGHARRLEDAIGTIGLGIPEETSAAMQGLLRDAEEIVAAPGDGLAKDAALIAAAQRVEHYEIAAYGTVRTLADQLDYTDARRMFDDTLDEEANADRRLTKLATGGRLSTGINERAAPR
jgi:ferritin-like metal-binding protein YciE